MGSSASQKAKPQEVLVHAGTETKGSNASRAPRVKQDLHQLSLSPEEDQIDIPDVDGDFKPNFAEFPSHVTLRHENVRYWKWRKKNPDARPLHPRYPDPDIVRKKDIFQLRDFMAADQRALTTPSEYLDSTLEELVAYLIQPFSDDLRRARVLFRWICSQDLHGLTEEGCDESARYYLFGVNCGFISHSELYLLMCSIINLECKMIEGVTKASQYNAGDEIRFDNSSSWNAVKINNSWHLLDVNFASCSINKKFSGWDLLDDNGEGQRSVRDEPQEIRYHVTEFYFLTNPEEFIYNHFPKEEGWQLLARPVNKQEFQNMAYLKTGFFEMDMECLQEKRCKVHSQSAETLLKLALPKHGTRHFAYQLYKSSKDKNWDSNADKMAQFVFLEQREGTVMIKVIYPVPGNYTLSLFISDTASDSCLSYSWAADYLLICDSNKKGRSALPYNSRYEWGPGHDTQKLGMTAVTHPQGTIETDDGEAEVVFNLSSLVDILTKLRSETQVEESLQQSLVHRTEDSQLIINARLQKEGTYALDIYAKQQGDGGAPTLVCTYLVNSSSDALEPFRFPKLDGPSAGALSEMSKYNITPVSHKKAYFTSKEGFEEILFQYSSQLSFMAEVSADFGDGMEKVENHTFIEQTDTKVTFKVRFPKAGIYSVKICAKKLDDTGPYKAVYNYIVHVPVRMKDCEPFPVQYVRLGCKVDGVESGYLVEGEDVSMDVVIPGASSVAAVCDGKITTFTKGENGCWAGVFNTGKAGKTAQLSAQFAKTDALECLFEYQVKEKEELEAMRKVAAEKFQSEQNQHTERETERKKKQEAFELLQKELEAAIESEDLSKLQKAVTKVEKGCYTNRLREEYTKAKDLIKSLERIEKLKKSILQMNSSTMAEIRSYNHPPQGVHEIMMSTLLLLRHPEGITKDWKQCQALCNTSVLSKEVSRFDVKQLHPEIAARARVLLQAYRIEEIALKSAGAAAFYTWVVGMTDELDQLTGGSVKKATPALTRRQKDIFKC